MNHLTPKLEGPGIPSTKNALRIQIDTLIKSSTWPGVSKNRGKNPKMDGENHGKPYEQMDDLGGKTHYFRKHPHIP